MGRGPGRQSRPGEARLRHTAVGLNVRRGLYPVPLPSGLGYTYEDFVERIETITQGRGGL